jgi:hypothetical protein
MKTRRVQVSARGVVVRRRGDPRPALGMIRHPLGFSPDQALSVQVSHPASLTSLGLFRANIRNWQAILSVDPGGYQ